MDDYQTIEEVIMDKRYYPGFDWVKLLGATIFAFYHIVEFPFLYEKILSIQIISILGGFVPVFFLISGFLMYNSLITKEDPKKYVVKYVFKYGLIYAVLCLVGILQFHIQCYFETGDFRIHAFIVKVCTMFFRSPPMKQLWFVPPLIVGIIINSFVFMRKKERAFFWILIPATVFIIGFEIGGHLLMGFELVRIIKTTAELRIMTYFLSRAIQGVFFIHLGMLISKYRETFDKIRIWNIIPFAIIMIAIDSFLISRYGSGNLNDLKMNASMAVFAIVIFLFSIQIEGTVICKYHSFVTIYTGILFFAHVLEDDLLRLLFNNSWIRFFLILIINFILSWYLDKKRQFSITKTP